MGNKKLTSKEVIDKLEQAIKNHNKQDMLNMVSPDDPDILPNWDYEDFAVWSEWEALVEEAMELLGL